MPELDLSFDLGGRTMPCKLTIDPEAEAAWRRTEAAFRDLVEQSPYTISAPIHLRRSEGIGVKIALTCGDGPRHGGLAFFCTTSPHGGI